MNQAPRLSRYENPQHRKAIGIIKRSYLWEIKKFGKKKSIKDF